jgi:RNA polymerase sigma-70 factor (ECF subfamily)
MHRESEAALDQRALARRIRDGDVAAFEIVFRTHYNGLCSFVRQQVGSAEAAEEVVQEVFLNVWRGRGGIDPDQSLRAYLYRAARNTALNQLKRRRLERRWLAASAGPTSHAISAVADDAVREHELTIAIQQRVASLPERCRLIFTMSREQGLSYAEIAEALGISVKTVETQMGRALKTLRAGLAAFLP